MQSVVRTDTLSLSTPPRPIYQQQDWQYVVNEDSTVASMQRQFTQMYKHKKLG